MQFSAPIYRLKRQAKQRARKENIPLHQALDDIAADEGFSSWSLLATHAKAASPVSEILRLLRPGELILLAARPEQGKTLLGLELVMSAVNAGRHGGCFSFEYTLNELRRRFTDLDSNFDCDGSNVLLDTSDEICASYILDQLAQCQTGGIILVDYLQLLDQKRANPPLEQQIRVLKSFAKQRQITFVFISQIDRRYDPGAGLPSRENLRLPNALDLNLFDRGIYLHQGKINLEPIAADKH